MSVHEYFALALGLVSICYLWTILFLRRGLLCLRSENEPGNPTFSVVVAAHNEKDHVKACLTSVLSQSIPPDQYEVILVDDRSQDGTHAVASRLADKHSNLSIVKVDKTPAGYSPKKYAISVGVGRARNEIVVFTDADCVAPATWLETVGRYFGEKTGLVQGITTYCRPAGMGPVFFGLQAVDFVSHGIVSAAAIGAHLPLNSNANNFAFRREIFASVSGYGETRDVVSGDDDLLLQRTWRQGDWEIRYMTNPAGAVQTHPTPTLRGVAEQRKRWASKTVHYNAGQVLFLGGIFAFYLGLAASLLLAAWHRLFLGVFVGMLCLKIAGEFLLMWPGTRIFDRKSLRKFILPASLLQTPLVLYAVFAGVFGRFEWKQQNFSRRAR